MGRLRHSRTIATVSHIGMDVPDEVAFPLIMERLMQRRRITAAGCWEYTGYILPNGYGEICFKGKQVRVHRLVYRIVKGEIPDGKNVCHSCDNTICFNPDHLEPGTQRENILQSVERQRHHETVKTHCSNGHAFADHGIVYKGKKKRFCKMCAIIRYRISAGWSEHDARTQPVHRGRRVGMVRGSPRPPTSRSTTHCKHGHEFTEANVYRTPDGRRNCRRCHHDSVKRFRPKKPECFEIDAGAEPT